MKKGKLLDFFKRSKQQATEPEDPELEQARRELEQLQAQYGDGNTLDPQKALEYLLHVGLHGACGTPEIVEGDHLVLPEWNITLTPSISELSERGAVLDFRLYAPQWGRELYECCAGIGSSPGQAMGMAAGSFAFSFMQGIARMEQQLEPQHVQSQFGGEPHRWQLYISDLIGTGKLLSPRDKEIHTGIYWEALKDDILKRLGNQALCYVKVYGAKVGDSVTGECRINDIKSEELSAKVAQMVQTWKVENFASHKQFFFLRQEESTARPIPYQSREGQAELKAKVIQAVRLFQACQTQEQYDTLEQRMAQELGDPTLATECFRFLPEICAEYAYQEQVTFAESIELTRPGHASLHNTIYKSQLADFYPIGSALFEAFDQGVFGAETNDIYRNLIQLSAACHCLEQARQKDGSLNGCMSALVIPTGPDFELR